MARSTVTGFRISVSLVAPSLRVALFPSDETACGAFRMRLPAGAAGAEEGVEVVFPSGEFTADVVVFQRPGDARIAAAIPRLQRRGIAVVVDVDDDLQAVNPALGVVRANWRNVRRACRLADLVTVTTPALAAVYGGEKARVLPNLVPRSLLAVRARRDGRTIGWGGNLSTHRGDLRVTRGGVAQAVQETGARFLHVGPEHPDVRRDLGLAELDCTGGHPFGEYHQALARLDVTIAPLADTRFNRGKSGLKILEAAALGIPCVASPLPDYERLAGDGLCVLARDKARDWRRECERFLTDERLRVEFAAEARESVQRHHTYETKGWVWAETWTEAAELRRTARRLVAA